MAYTKTNWVNDGPPALSATNLNKIEQGVYDAHDQKADKSALDAALHGATGHKHTGGEGDGPPVEFIDANGRRWKHAVLEHAMRLVDTVTSPNCTHVYSLTNSDDTYLYVACLGGTAKHVLKIRKSDMAQVGGIDITEENGFPYSIKSDDTYLYVAVEKVIKIRKSDMAKVGETASYGISGEYFSVLDCDEDYIYAGGKAGKTNRKVWKIRKSDMAKVGETASIGGSIGELQSISLDDDFVYVGGNINLAWKIRKSDMVKVGETASYGGNVRAIVNDDNYIYLGGSTTNKVYKMDKTSLELVKASESYGDIIMALSIDGSGYLYAGGATTCLVWKIRTSDMHVIVSDLLYPNTINDLTNDDHFIYAGGAGGCIYKALSHVLSFIPVS